MSALTTMPPYELPPRAMRWTRAMCARLEEAGILCERYELIEGVIFTVGQNMPHVNVVSIIIEWLFQTFGRPFVVTQTSIDVRPEEIPTNEPMPDVLVLTRPADQFDRYPLPSEIRLLVEVSDSTVRFDLTTKAGLYARAEIVEYWDINLPDRCLTIHRSPQNGAYHDIQIYKENEVVSALAAPASTVLVARLLPTLVK
jgi:Uma2 family endonuclease